MAATSEDSRRIAELVERIEAVLHSAEEGGRFDTGREIGAIPRMVNSEWAGMRSQSGHSDQLERFKRHTGAKGRKR